MSQTPTRIYRWWDADGVLLYIGITKDLERRKAQHLAGSSWAQWANRMEIDPVVPATRSDVERMERDAIRIERPIFNRTDSPEWWLRQEAYLLANGSAIDDATVGRWKSKSTAGEQVRVTLWMTPEEKRDLKVVAADAGMTIAGWVTELVTTKRSELQ